MEWVLGASVLVALLWGVRRVRSTRHDPRNDMAETIATTGFLFWATSLWDSDTSSASAGYPSDGGGSFSGFDGGGGGGGGE